MGNFGKNSGKCLFIRIGKQMVNFPTDKKIGYKHVIFIQKPNLRALDIVLQLLSTKALNSLFLKQLVTHQSKNNNLHYSKSKYWW